MQMINRKIIKYIRQWTNLGPRLFKEKSSWRRRFSAVWLLFRGTIKGFLRFYNAISSLNTWSTSFDDFC